VNVTELTETLTPVEREVASYEFRLKCLACGLHYTVLSWDEHWAIPEGESGTGGREGGYCPECGTGGQKMVWGPVPRQDFIFQIVPGDSREIPLAFTGPMENPF
jgi:hypothetical protein